MFVIALYATVTALKLIPTTIEWIASVELIPKNKILIKRQTQNRNYNSHLETKCEILKIRKYLILIPRIYKNIDVVRLLALRTLFRTTVVNIEPPESRVGPRYRILLRTI